MGYTDNTATPPVTFAYPVRDSQWDRCRAPAISRAAISIDSDPVTGPTERSWASYGLGNVFSPVENYL